MTKVAAISIATMIKLLVIAAELRFQNWMADLQVIKPVGKKACRSITAIAIFHKRFA